MGRTASRRSPRLVAPPPDPGLPEIVQAMEFDILFGRLKPRERLTEDTLMARFGATRHVVRQALAELERIGIVTRAPNRGAAVRDFSASEVEEIAEVRATLHRGAVQRIRLPVERDVVAQLSALQRAHDRAVAARDPRAIDVANEAFHDAFFAACGNRHLAEAIGRYAYLSRAMRLYPMVDPALLETLKREHWAMIEAMREGDRKALMQLVVEHIQHSKRIYLEVRRSLEPLPLVAVSKR